jgi:hypothetical protein
MYRAVHSLTYSVGIACVSGLLLFSLGCVKHKSSEMPAPPVETAQPQSRDLFVGSWKMNPGRSSPFGIEQELLTIEHEDGRFRITSESRNTNGTEFHYSTVTDMAGGTVKLTQPDGRPMGELWQVTRLSERSFVINSLLGKQVMERREYQISADGEEMIMRSTAGQTGLIGGTNGSGEASGNPQILVFDRIH